MCGFLLGLIEVTQACMLFDDYPTSTETYSMHRFDGSDFRGADLRDARAARSSFRGCRWDGAELAGADFRDAVDARF